MRALLVYESMFGSNRTVAAAIAAGLGPQWKPHVVEVGHAPVVIGPDVDLLVVGGPNHQFGLSRPASRAAAAEETGKEPIISVERGLREWLAALDVERHGQPAAVWDTRLVAPRALHLVDHGAKTIARRLTGAGAQLVAAPEHFDVAEMKGPLADGEEARARRFGEQLAATVVMHA